MYTCYSSYHSSSSSTTGDGTNATADVAAATGSTIATVSSIFRLIDERRSSEGEVEESKGDDEPGQGTPSSCCEKSSSIRRPPALIRGRGIGSWKSPVSN